MTARYKCKMLAYNPVLGEEGGFARSPCCFWAIHFIFWTWRPI